MTEPSLPTVKHLFALSGNLCAFPECNLHIIEDSGVVTGEICHIEAKNINGPRFNQTSSDKERHAFENLVLLCRRHHKVIDSQPDLYTVEVLKDMKAMHEADMGRNEKTQDTFFAKILLNDLKKITISNNTGNVAVNSPGVIQTNIVTVKTASKKVKIEAPPGTLGSNQLINRYISYLINRYNKFASSDKNRKSKFNYGAISKNIETNFGSKWQLLNENKVDEVIIYLQNRINKTFLAKVNKSKGYRAFSTFEEFINNHEN